MALLAAWALPGCRPPATPPDVQAPIDVSAAEPKEDETYAKFRAGLVAVESAMDSLREARQELRTAAGAADGDARAALEDASDALDTAGARLAELAIEPPSAQAFADGFAGYDELRLKLIEAANDGLIEVRDAQGTVEDIAESRPNLADQAATVRLAGDDLANAVGALGGTAEDPAATS